MPVAMTAEQTKQYPQSGELYLVWFCNDLLMGSKHVDGRSFDSPANRPTNLQIPLIRQK